MKLERRNPRSGSSRARVIVRCTLGAVLLTAGVLKLSDPVRFYTDLLAYDVAVPDVALRLVALTLPWLEVLCGGALLADFWPETVGFLVACLCISFVVMLGQAVLRGLDLNCGCLGTGPAGLFSHPIAALTRAGLLLAGAIWYWLRPSVGYPERPMPSARRPRSV